ncbi:MAG TPA: CpsD/CapB family tyrosine-protein kinase [Sandaracinaceae bacterium]
MGRIYDALRKAEQERRQRGGAATRTEPTLILDEELPGSGARVEPLFGDDGARAEPVIEPPTIAAPSATALVEPGAELVAVSDPASPAAEYLRAVKARIARTLAEQGHRSLLVTSPGRGDGKTFVASNLALLLAAEVGTRVLLVDADLRRPRLHTLFGATRSPGLSEIGDGRLDWWTAVVTAPWNGLQVMPAGGPTSRPAETLNTPAARGFFAAAREAYDYVIIDAPPVLPVADAAVLAGHLDAVVMVTRQDHTPRQALVAAGEALARAHVLGVVLNAMEGRGPLRRSYYEY